MSRKDDLLNYICSTDQALTMYEPIVDEILFLESQLTELKRLPFIKVHPDNPQMQKATPAAKQYKELLQQYTNCIKTISRITGDDDKQEDSPLRKWVREHVEQEVK